MLAQQLAQPASDLSFMKSACLLLAHIMSVPPGNPGRRRLAECLRQCHRCGSAPPESLFPLLRECMIIQ